MGLGIAWDACLRGLDVLLVESSYLGAGTTNRSLAMLHSGARYVLQSPQTARDCAAENRILRVIAPLAIEDRGGYYLQLKDDPEGFVQEWTQACLSCQVWYEELEAETVLSKEPLINPTLTRAFRVADAAIDSFTLVHSLAQSIQEAGGEILEQARLIDLDHGDDRIERATIERFEDGTRLQVEPEMIVNACGPWVSRICKLADIELPLSWSRGTMFATEGRLVSSILNRCRRPADGDVLIPIGDISIFGTTIVPANDPVDLQPQSWEVDLLFDQARSLIPDLPSCRMLRAWSAIQCRSENSSGKPGSGREEHGTHKIIDHEIENGKAGMLTIVGGMLTTFRLIGEQVVDLICEKTGRLAAEKTRTTAVRQASSGKQVHRGVASSSLNRAGESTKLICECEGLSKAVIQTAIEEQGLWDLEALRLRLKVGRGSCQAAYCGYRALSLLIGRAEDLQSQYRRFNEQRWRDQRLVAWGSALQQMEYSRRVLISLVGFEDSE